MQSLRHRLASLGTLKTLNTWIGKRGLVKAAAALGASVVVLGAGTGTGAVASPVPPPAPVTIQIQGTVTGVNDFSHNFDHPIAAGDPFTVTYTYDANLPDANADPTMGEYRFTTGAGYGLTTVVDGMTFQTATDTSGANRIEVFHNNQYNADRYDIWASTNQTYNGLPVSMQRLQMYDNTKTANVSDALLTGAPNMASYQTVQFDLSMGGGFDRSSFYGDVNSIQVVQTPEPASLGLLSAAGVLALRRRRRR